MADIRTRLKDWWQEKNSGNGGQAVHVSQDMLHLFRLRREHRLLRLKFAGIGQDFQSLLLEVDQRNGRLLLDEPFPTLADGELLNGRRLEVASIEGAASTRFDTQVQGLVTHRGLMALAVALPGSVVAAQRRNHYRLPVQENMPIQAILRLEGQGNLGAKVLDLSGAGVRLLVPSLASHNAPDTAPLYLRLGNEQGMLCTLRVCNLQHSQNRENSLVGGQLVGLNPQQSQLIERFIARTQRMQRQREMTLES